MVAMLTLEGGLIPLAPLCGESLRSRLGALTAEVRAGDDSGLLLGDHVVLGDGGVAGRVGLPHGFRLSRLDGLALRALSKDGCFFRRGGLGETAWQDTLFEMGLGFGTGFISSVTSSRLDGFPFML